MSAITAMKMAYARKASVTRNAGTSTSQKRICALMVALTLLSSAPVLAQATLAPNIFAQFFDSNGNPLASGRICVFGAGTSTLATTYLSSTISAGNAQTNPIVLNGAGRPSNGGAVVGIWLAPGASYKFILKDATTTTCVPDTGVTLLTIDNVQAVPGSSVNLDVTGTAGESLAAGDLVYKSTGSGGGGANAGQWYKADADSATTSTSVFNIGMVPDAIAAGATGTIRLGGAVTVSGPLTPGAAYYASSTAGSITATPPTNAIRIGQATSATMIDLQFIQAPSSPRGPPCGRLTLTSGVPVTSADVTAATTVYYTPYLGCNQISVYNGTQWSAYAFAQLSIAVPATTNQMYDVFLYDNAGTLALELTAWTNDTTRATALTTQNGVNVKTGALTRLYLGSFRTTGVSGQTEDSLSNRLVWNAYNRVDTTVRRVESTANWNYTTATFRQANNSTSNQISVVTGLAEDGISLEVVATFSNTNLNVAATVAIGQSSTSAAATGCLFTTVANEEISTNTRLGASLDTYPAVGYSYFAWLEQSAATGTTTWYGVSAGSIQSGIAGRWRR